MKTKAKPIAKRVATESAFFVTAPKRTVEWLGHVDYHNLERVVSELKSHLAVAPTEEVQLIISSPGGQTGIAMCLYDAASTWLGPLNLTTIGSGDVDSSGIILFATGKRRYVTKNTTMLLHLAGRTFGADKRFSTRDMENMLKEDRLKDLQYARVVADATEGRYTAADILELMERETVLTAEEAVKMGLAHAVLK